MKIIIYIEALRTFTSGTPHRGILIKLIELCQNDEFVLVLREGYLSEHMQELFNRLKKFPNWTLVYEKKSRKLVNFLALIHSKNHCKISVKGDLYLNFDAEYLGAGNYPQIITVHDLSSVRSDGTSSISPIKRIARKFAIENGIKHSNYIVSISDFTKNDIIDYFQIENKKITTIHNGIDSEWFLKNKIKKKIKDNYWIWWGAFSERKNLERLLIAYKLFLEKNRKYQNIPDLYFIGTKNEYSKKLDKIIENSSTLQEKVYFFNSMELNNLKIYVKNSKGLLFPSLYEGFGLPVIEAYSQGVPVLTSNISSLPEIAGNLGFFVNPKDIKSIENGLEKLYLPHFSEIELKEWAKKFSYEIGFNKYLKVIQKCIKEN